MISIIICSKKEVITDELRKNISETIGSDYELIVIDNSLTSYTIFEAYNMGIAKSRGSILCFMHDDIAIHSKNWGSIANNIFEADLRIGLIGIAGAKTKTKMPSAWWDCAERNRVVNIIQHSHDRKERQEYGFNGKNIQEVVVIDGVFMMMRKSTNLLFDTTIGRFHNYDLNISIEHCLNNYKVMVTNEILIEHFSQGSINIEWYVSSMRLQELYGRYLPLKSSDIEYTGQDHNLEFVNGSRFASSILGFGYKREAIQLWLPLLSMRIRDKFHVQFLKSLLKKC